MPRLTPLNLTSTTNPKHLLEAVWQAPHLGFSVQLLGIDTSSCRTALQGMQQTFGSCCAHGVRHASRAGTPWRCLATVERTVAMALIQQAQLLAKALRSTCKLAQSCCSRGAAPYSMVAIMSW